MDGTPKLQRKASLSLSTRLNHKRHSASPQNRLKTSTSTGSINSRDHLNAKCVTPQRSPSVISICSDGGIECTPPHKKIIMNLDDSLDYSPKVFDSSFSPSCLLSQTLAIDSPEVGWKWSRHGANGEGSGGGGLRYGFEDISTRTPDSAYAADSSFASAGSSSTEVVGNRQRFAYDGRRDDQRKILEQELRRVEKTKAEEKLKQRCAKLQEQLKSAGTQNSKTKSQNNKQQTKVASSSSSSLNDVEMKSQTSSTNKNFTCTSKSESFNDIEMQTAPTISKTTTVKFHTPEKPNKTELLNDFFNDSDSDCFLLEATQEIESKMEAKTQPVFANFATNTPKSSTSSECNSIPHANSAPAATTTPPPAAKKSSVADTSRPNSENKEKRSSFYMKFLEDDCSDDWFVSLDEEVLQATQTKKPRTSLLRYKSMPTATATNSNVNLNKKDKNDNCIIGTSSSYTKRLEDAEASSSSLSKMKRHSSTHNLSPAAGTSYRSRKQL